MAQKMSDMQVIDALRIIGVITDVVDILPNIFDTESSICQMMSKEADDAVRKYAYKYYRGTDRLSIARAVEDIYTVFLASIDKLYGNNNNKIDAVEREKMAVLFSQDLNLRLLLCYHLAYKEFY
jgi:hypothetical protein